MPTIQIQPYGDLDKKIDEYAEKWKIGRGDAVLKMIDKFKDCEEHSNQKDVFRDGKDGMD